MKTDGIRLLGWIIPILCMVGAGWILFKERQEFAAADTARNNANRDVQEAQQEKQKFDHLPPEKRFAAVDDVPEEETDFLTYVRTHSAADGVTFDKWLSQSIEYGKDKGSTPQDEKTAALLKGIRKVSSTLTLTGSYTNIRKLVGDMESNDRLYTLNNLTWTLSKTGTTCAMTVSRYVAPPKPAPRKGDAPAPSGTAPGAKTVSPGITTTP